MGVEQLVIALHLVASVVGVLAAAVAVVASFRIYRFSVNLPAHVRTQVAAVLASELGAGQEPAPPPTGDVMADALDRAPSMFAFHRQRAAASPSAAGAPWRLCKTHGAVQCAPDDHEQRCPVCGEPTIADAPPPHLRM